MRIPRRNMSRLALAVVSAGAVLLAASGVVRAQVVTSDQPAGLLIFPLVEVDETGILNGGVRVETVIEISNTNPLPAPPAAPSETRALHCFWIDATGTCSNNPSQYCNPESNNPVENCRAIGGVCVPGDCSVTNFFVEMTPDQPIGFRASEGDPNPPCSNAQPPNDQCPIVGPVGVGNILPVPHSPFVGELKCVQVTSVDSPEPAPLNDLIGKARVYRMTSGAAGGVDVSEYNAIGVQTFPFSTGQPDPEREALCLGTLAVDPTNECPTQEYAACPSTLILDHFFDGAQPFGDAPDPVGTELTLVPCTEELEVDVTPATTVAQMLITNEFEQRFSSATRVQCSRTVRLSDIDTPAGPGPDDAGSVFAVGVQGTLTGQTRIRGVPSDVQMNGLLGVAREFYAAGYSDAFNLHYEGVRPAGAGDRIYKPIIPLP